MTFDDLQWFDKTVRRVIGEDMTEEHQEIVTQSPFFSDFMRYWSSAGLSMPCDEALRN